MNLFITYLYKDPSFFLGASIMIIFSICAHEFMHAWVALKQGDTTAADAGHLTLNPLKQMGPYSLLMFALIGIAWGQVPVRPAHMRHRWSHALVSFAGPATNLGLFFIFGIAAFCTMRYLPEQKFAAGILQYGSLINAVLFMLNLIPVPGLDGWNVLTYFVPRLTQAKSELLSGAFFAVFLLVFIFIRVLFDIGTQMLMVLYRILIALLGYPPA